MIQLALAILVHRALFRAPTWAPFLFPLWRVWLALLPSVAPARPALTKLPDLDVDGRVVPARSIYVPIPLTLQFTNRTLL